MINPHKQCFEFNLSCLLQLEIITAPIKAQDIFAQRALPPVQKYLVSLFTMLEFSLLVNRTSPVVIHIEKVPLLSQQRWSLNGWIRATSICQMNNKDALLYGVNPICALGETEHHGHLNVRAVSSLRSEQGDAPLAPLCGYTLKIKCVTKKVTHFAYLTVSYKHHTNLRSFCLLYIIHI